MIVASIVTSVEPEVTLRLCSASKMVFDNSATARYMIVVLKIFGLWNHKTLRWRRLYRLYSMLLHTYTYLYVCGTFVNVVKTLNDINQLSGAFYMMLTNTTFLTKMLVFLWNKRTVMEIFEIFAHAYDGQPRTATELAMLQSEHKSFARLRDFYGGGIIITLSIAFVSSLFTGNLPFPYWIPFDYRCAPNFYYAYMIVTAGVTVTATPCGALDLSMAYFLFQIANCYKLLGQRLADFSGEPELLDMRLKQLIQFHNFIVDITAKCERLISMPVMVQIFMSAFVICFTAFRLNTMHFLDDPSNFVVLLVFGMVMALQIYLPCSYGNELTLSAFNLTNAIYSSNWFQLPTQTQKDINIYMEYLKRPVVVRAGSFFAIGLPIFTQTMNNAYRLYAVLVNMGK